MIRLIKTSFRQRAVAIAAYSLGGAAIVWMYVSIFPSLASQADTYSQLMESLPQGIMKAFAGGTLTGTSFEALIGIKQYGLIWPIMMLFLMVSLAGNYMAAEIEKGTIGLWLSAPVSRLKVYWSKYLTGVIALIIFTVLSVMTVLPIAKVYNVQVVSSDFWALSLMGALFGLAVYGLSMLLSASSSEKSRVYMVMGVLLLVMYLANVVAELYPKLEKLQYTSFFYYYDVAGILSGNAINRVSVVVFSVVAVVSTLLGAWVFNKRDISI